MNIPRMSYPQYRKARRLTYECCNYCNGNCLLLDDGEECVCVQSISYSLLCRWFKVKRGVWQTVSIVLLIAFLCAFFTLFDGFICQKEQDMESAYAVIPVTVVVSNLTGTKTDDLKITDYIINYFLSDKYAYGGELQEKAFSSYVKDVCLKASVYYSQGTGFSSRQKLIGITSVDAASELAPVSGNSITYFEGYDESIFTSNKAVCLVSTAAAEELSQDTDNSGNVILTVQMSPAATGEASTQISLEIAGTYSSKSQTIYCPFSCVAAVQTELDGKITGDITVICSL